MISADFTAYGLDEIHVTGQIDRPPPDFVNFAHGTTPASCEDGGEALRAMKPIQFASNAIIAAALMLVAACGGSSPPQDTVGPGAAQSVVDTPAAPADAARFLNQATFGATQADVDSVMRSGYSAWFRGQLGAGQTSAIQDYVARLAAASASGQSVDGREIIDFAYRAEVGQGDQLRQRMVFSLSQIIVVSIDDPGVAENTAAMAAFVDVLNKDAFGNYRGLLEDVTYSPAMAIYLTYLNSEKENSETGQAPDENYARELMQLFSIGLVRLNQDGTPELDSQGRQIETYTNNDITGLAKVFTGFSWDDGNFGGRTADRGQAGANYAPLHIFPEFHSLSEKSFLGTTVPANTDGPTSVARALDTLMAHQNVAPFIARQLIQRYVTSNPTPEYVARVAEAFTVGTYRLPDRSVVGAGGKGDLAATLAAVLFDTEARDLSRRNDPNFGRVREPALRFAHWARVAGVNSPTVLPANGLSENFTAENANTPESLGQMQYRSPSVFNFYRPGYVAAGGATAAAGLVAPELQIVTTQSATGYANFMRGFIQNTTQTSSFLPSYGPEIALADRPDALIDRLNLLLTGAALSPENRTAILAAVNAISIRSDHEGEDRRNRVNLAMLMIVLSPEFTVQR